MGQPILQTKVEKITTLTRNTGKIANLSNITQLLKMETAKYVSCNFNTKSILDNRVLGCEWQKCFKKD